jgi:predicted nucleic acid-binding protein
VLHPVRARVVDITRDCPRGGDRLYVDTNVWIKIAYSRTSAAEAKPYAAFVGAVLRAGAGLIAGQVAYAEIAKHIESTELNLWLARAGNTRPPHEMLKTFRADLAERKNVLAQIRGAWSQMNQMASLPAVCIEPGCLTGACDGLDAGDFLDGGDAIQLADARKSGLDQVLTADKDFVSVPGIFVFTANRLAVTEAAALGLLLQR